MEKRTKHYLQKYLVRKFLGKKLYSRIKFFKIYFKAKIGTNYEISSILLDVLNRDDVFFDIGANQGQYIFRILNKFKSTVWIYAFEPVNINCKMLSGFVEKKYNNIRIENFAVSDVCGSNFLYIPLLDNIEIDTQASINYENRKMYYKDFVKQEIRTETIDNYICANNISKIDYLKVDTEGNDDKVLKGALKSICDFRPIILCEDMDNKDMLNTLSDLSYNSFVLNKNKKLININKANKLEIFNDLIIFIPQTRMDVFTKHIDNLTC